MTQSITPHLNKDIDLGLKTNYEDPCKLFQLLTLLLRCPEISSNPKSILEKARLINEASTMCFTHVFRNSLNIYLVYLKLFPSAQEDDFASMLYQDLCKHNSGFPADNIALFEAITDIGSKNAPLARLLAEKITNPYTAFDAYLAIANITKNPADLRQIKLLKPKLTPGSYSNSFVTAVLKKYPNAIRTAIVTMKDISLARELAAHLMGGWNDPKLMTDYKAYLMIYSSVKQSEDIEQAEKIAENIEYVPNKIKAYRKLYVNLLNIVKQDDKSHALAEAAILTHNAQHRKEIGPDAIEPEVNVSIRLEREKN